MNKQIKESIFFSACKDCQNKTITEMKNLIRTEKTECDILYNYTIETMIEQRQTELNYSDGTGALYI